MKSILNISEASNLGIHALAYIATVGRGQTVSTVQIATDLNVSESHLAKILQRLSQNGLLSSTRGKHGGFFFEKDPDTLTLWQIMEAVDGKLEPEGCLLGKSVCGLKNCRLQGLSKRVAALVEEELSQIKLMDLRISKAKAFQQASYTESIR